MQPKGFAIGRLFGTDIYASPDFFLLILFYFLIFGGNVGAVALFVAALILSLLVHEFGHVFAVRWLLGGRSVVLLWGLGGLCFHEPTHDRKKQIGISLMGPVFGFLLAGLVWLIARFAPLPSPVLRAFVAILLYINVLWNALNLLPIWPLDGGQALRAGLAMRLGGATAARIVRRTSIITAGAGIAAALHYRYIFAAIIATMLLLQNLRVGAVPHD